jgi:hypothetical protein
MLHRKEILCSMSANQHQRKEVRSTARKQYYVLQYKLFIPLTDTSNQHNEYYDIRRTSESQKVQPTLIYK